MVLDDIENLNIILMDSKSMRATEMEQTLKSCNSSNNGVQLTINNILQNGEFSLFISGIYSMANFATNCSKCI